MYKIIEEKCNELNFILSTSRDLTILLSYEHETCTIKLLFT